MIIYYSISSFPISPLSHLFCPLSVVSVSSRLHIDSLYAVVQNCLSAVIALLNWPNLFSPFHVVRASASVWLRALVFGRCAFCYQRPLSCQSSCVL